MIDFDATVLAAAQAAFAEAVAWVPRDYPAATVQAIVFDGVVEEKWSDGLASVERVTRIDVRASAFPRPPRQHDMFALRGRSYLVTEAQADGVGGITLRLRLATDAEARRPALPPAA